jgi:hypothetical protein
MKSASKHKMFQPTTPMKKNKRQMNGDIMYSPVSNIIIFDEDHDKNMKVRTVQSKTNRLNLDFEVVSKIGEGSFGEALKVVSKTDGSFYAIKKAK